MYIEDTIAAITTPLGEGGVGIIRISGSQAYTIGLRIFHSKSKHSLAKGPTHKIYYGHIFDESGQVLDEVLALVMKAPRSYTAEDVLEIHCHGGITPLKSVLALILRMGARLADPGEFTKRAFLNGRLDLSQAEAVMDVIQAKSQTGLSIAMQQLEGRLSRYIEDLREELISLIAKLEVTIDYPEEDIEEMTLLEVKTALIPIVKKLEQLVGRAKTGRMVRDGICTVIVGKPNAGKSSLLNALLQEERAIVTDIPGTTRDSIDEYITVRGIPIHIIDTAGIRETTDKIEKIGVDRAKQYMESADLVLLVLDRAARFTVEDKDILAAAAEKQVIIVLNKQDLPPVMAIEELRAHYDCPIISVSTISGEGIAALEDQILKLVDEEGLTSKDNLIITNMRHIELIRESLVAIQDAEQTLLANMPVDCVVVDIKKAWELLGSMTGKNVQDDIVTEIFSRFCLGK